MARVSKFYIGQKVRSSENDNFTYEVKKVNKNTLTVVPTQFGYRNCKATCKKHYFTPVENN